MADRLCLHCEISELLQRRAAAGEPVDDTTIRRICEVIGDIANSIKRAGGDAAETFLVAHETLIRFEAEIAAGKYEAGRELVDAKRMVN